jgi:hypothetical protein
MLRKISEQNDLEWFKKEEPQEVIKEAAPVEQLNVIPDDLAAQGLDEDMLLYYSENTDSPEEAVESMADLGIRFTASSADIIKNIIVAGFEEEEEEEPTDEELKEIEMEEKSPEEEETVEVKASSAKQIITKVAKKLEDGSFKSESTSSEREVRYSGSGTETNFGGTHRVAPGQFSIFESFDKQVESMKLDDNKERIQKSVEARKNSIKELDDERKDMTLAALKEGLDLIQSKSSQRSVTEPAIKQSYQRVANDQISMFDGEGKSFAEEKTAKEKSIESAKERKENISRKSEKDDSWKKLNKGTRSSDKQAELVENLSKLFSSPSEDTPKDEE